MNKPLGPYSPFVRAGDFVIVSGQGGMRDGALVEGGVAAQTTQTMANVADRLADAGASLDDVVKTLCFLTDMGTFDEFNERLRRRPSAITARPVRRSRSRRCPPGWTSRSRPGLQPACEQRRERRSST